MISVARTAVAIDSWCDFGRHGARLDLVPSANAPRLSRAKAQSSLTPGLHKTGKAPALGVPGLQCEGCQFSHGNLRIQKRAPAEADARGLTLIFTTLRNDR